MSTSIPARDSPQQQQQHTPQIIPTSVAAAALVARDREQQIERYAAELQGAATPGEQRAVIEWIAREEPPTPLAVRRYYRVMAAEGIKREREGWEVGEIMAPGSEADELDEGRVG